MQHSTDSETGNGVLCCVPDTKLLSIAWSWLQRAYLLELSMLVFLVALSSCTGSHSTPPNGNVDLDNSSLVRDAAKRLDSSSRSDEVGIAPQDLPDSGQCSQRCDCHVTDEGRVIGDTTADCVLEVDVYQQDSVAPPTDWFEASELVKDVGPKDADGSVSDVLCDFSAWATVLGPNIVDEVGAVAMLLDGTVLVGGWFTGWKLDIGNLSLDNSDQGATSDGFVVAIDQDGSPLWVKGFGAKGNDLVFAVAPDESGGAFVGGAVSVPVSGECASEPLGGGPGLKPFLARLAPGGDCIWSKSFQQDSGINTVVSIAQVPGGAFVGGVFQSPNLEIGADVLENVGGECGDPFVFNCEDAFVALVQADGELAWSASFGGTGRDILHRTAYSGQERYIVAGSFTSETMEFGMHAVSNMQVGTADIFVASFDKTGTLEWVRSFGGVLDDYAVDLVVTTQGEIVLTGQLNSADVSFGGASSGNGKWSKVFVVKLSQTGDHVWTKTGSVDDGNLTPVSIALGANDEVLLVSGFSTCCPVVGSEFSDYYGGQDILVWQLNSAGEYVGNYSLGGELDDRALASAALQGDSLAIMVATDSPLIMAGDKSVTGIAEGGTMLIEVPFPAVPTGDCAQD